VHVVLPSFLGMLRVVARTRVGRPVGVDRFGGWHLREGVALVSSSVSLMLIV
jgi:hypothetical protein